MVARFWRFGRAFRLYLSLWNLRAGRTRRVRSLFTSFPPRRVEKQPLVRAFNLHSIGTCLRASWLLCFHTSGIFPRSNWRY